MYDYARQKGYILDEEKYITEIGEQQFINLNMTKMSNDILQGLTVYHLKRIRDKLKLNIPDENLICSIVLKQDCFN
jgi:predicted Co/Zn/Cd cation transporter (cation efflux family)